MKDDFENIIKNFSNISVGVIGDVMLDRFILGDVERISPEAPIPIVHVVAETMVPGGASNTAMNLSFLGANVSLVGVIGTDTAADQLLTELQKAKLPTTGLFRHPVKPTTQKTRVIARSQQLLRFDQENRQELHDEFFIDITKFIQKNLPDWNVIVISDYLKGFVKSDLVRFIIESAKKNNIPVIVDTKSKNIDHFKNCTIITPNHNEAYAITNTYDIDLAGKKIQERLNSNVLITQGGDGMTLFENDNVNHFPAKAKEIYDVVGAGDTVAATLALAIASGASFDQATTIANHAAGIAVGKVGTASVSINELLKDLQTNGE